VSRYGEALALTPFAITDLHVLASVAVFVVFIVALLAVPQGMFGTATVRPV
jgi:hypothetical protein